MKKKIKALLSTVLSLVIFTSLSGCIVFSLEPFFTEKNKIDIPEQIQGFWQPVQIEGEKPPPNISQWKITDDSMMTFDEDNNPGEIEITFFKIKDTLYCNTRAGTPDDKVINQYWLYHLYPFHNLSKVVWNNDQLTFIPMNYDWLRRIVQEKKILPYYDWKSEDMILFTATSDQWEDFLLKYGKNKDAFSEDDSFILRKVAPTKSPADSHKKAKSIS